MKYTKDQIKQCYKLHLPSIYSEWAYFSRQCWIDGGIHKSSIPEKWQDSSCNSQFELDMISKYGDLWDCARLLVLSKRRRKQRIKKRLQPILSGVAKGYFITLDFAPESLKLTQIQRKKAVKEFSISQFDQGILNIDFGSEWGREHYHGICWIYGDHYKPDIYQWSLGQHPDIQEIYNADGAEQYVLKLINHSLKVVDNKNNLIYF